MPCMEAGSQVLKIVSGFIAPRLERNRSSISAMMRSCMGLMSGKPKKERARQVGKAIGDKLVALNIKAVVFDRNGYIFHGRVKEIADGARDAGLVF